MHLVLLLCRTANQFSMRHTIRCGADGVCWLFLYVPHALLFALPFGCKSTEFIFTVSAFEFLGFFFKVSSNIWTADIIFWARSFVLAQARLFRFFARKVNNFFTAALQRPLLWWRSKNVFFFSNFTYNVYELFLLAFHNSPLKTSRITRFSEIDKPAIFPVI